MMKKNFKRLLSVAMCLMLSLSTVFTAVGCGPEEEVFDDTKVNIRVTAYDGGYGMDWLEATANYFMNKYKDTAFGDKVGVDIHITKDRTLGNSFVSNYAVLDQDIYFVPGGDYDEFVSNEILLDVTDVFTEIPEENKGEGRTNKSIVDNMNDDVREYLAVKREDGKDHYYAMPAQGTGFGFNYDVDMFFNDGLYYKDGHGKTGTGADFIKPISWDKAVDGEYVSLKDGKYVTVLGDTLSTGPDGEYGTSDDGEPEHYSDFLNLCKYMKIKGINPCTWMKGAEAYVYDVATTLVYDYLGKDQVLAYRDGEGKIDIVTGFNGNTPIIQEDYDLDAAGANKVNVFKNPGLYWASYLIGSIFQNNYYSNMVTKEYTHLDAQYDLLLSSKRNTNNSNRVGFLLDGAYWEHEAMQNGLFDEAVKKTGQDYFKYENRKFKLLATPKVDGEELGKSTVSGVGNNYGVILKKVEKDPVKMEVCKMFFQCLFSDQGNMDYTAKTSLCRPMDFPLDEEGLTYYGKILRELYTERADVVSSLTRAKWAKDNSSYLQSRWCTTYQGKDYDRQIIELFLNQKCPIKDYFTGIYARQERRFGVAA